MPEMSDPRSDGHSINGDCFTVLVNAEGQHSVWPAAKTPPEGWTEVGPPASKAACIALIEARWTDMRPQGLRDTMRKGMPGAD